MASVSGKKRACRGCDKPNAIIPAWYCPTCKRSKKKAASAKAHDARVTEVYGLEPGEYDMLLRAQGGVCAICKRATGAKRRLAVDHDHTKTGRESVRGLLCKICNYYVLGRFARDSIEPLQNAIDYLTKPPAPEVLGIDTEEDYE
jgi:hypothetical protein